MEEDVNVEATQEISCTQCTVEYSGGQYDRFSSVHTSFSWSSLLSHNNNVQISANYKIDILDISSLFWDLDIWYNLVHDVKTFSGIFENSLTVKRVIEKMVLCCKKKEQEEVLEVKHEGDKAICGTLCLCQEDMSKFKRNNKT